MTPQELLKKMEEQCQQIDVLIKLWKQLFPEFTEHPGPRQFQVWLNMYGFETTVQGLQAAQVFYNKRLIQIEAGEQLPHLSLAQLIKYASGCMKNKKIRAEEEA